ncbi:MAG: hypothetical protein MJ188_08840 [Treponema sp.]|nr:hypothetical protein [Treponema sp.]
MAELNDEVGVITHLLQVEKDASGLIDEAVKDAEEKLSIVRAQANQEFKEKYNFVIDVLEKEYNQNVEILQNAHAEEIKAFQESLQTRNQNKKAFFNLLDNILQNELN